MSTTYAIASAKGGVGKTTTVANLGAALAAAGEDVVVVDADIGMANLAGALGVAVEGATLHDLLSGDADLAAAIHEGPEGLAVVPGSPSLSDYREADPTGLAELVDELADDYEFVLLDTGAGLSHDTVLPLGLADEVVLVSTARRDALANTDKTRELVDRLGGTVAGLVLTRAPAEGESPEAVEASVLERVPDDPSVDKAIEAGSPVVLFAPASPAAVAYRRLTATLFDVEVPQPEGVESDDAEAEASAAEAEASKTAASTPDAEADVETKTQSEAEAVESTGDAEPSEDEKQEVPTTAAEGEPEETEAGEPETEETEADEAEATETETDETETAEDEADETKQSQKSVGPLREEDVPISEAEDEGTVPEPPRSDAVSDEAPIDEAEEQEKEKEKEKKGFLRRLLGR